MISPLIPTSYDSRAGSPEETIGNAFKVTINNPDKQFEFLRLYSIFRSSKDTTPVCKKVMDVRIGYGGDSSTELHISQDKRSSSYERSTIYDIQYKKDIDHNFINLLSSNTYLGKNDIQINGVTFKKNKYYLFSKEALPKLILKAKLFDFESGQLKSNPEYITWDSNTDILICETLSGEEGYYDIWPINTDAKFIVASDISYTASVFMDDSVTITDNNTLGEDVDANEILFVGGEEITAGTLTQKDGTMFLGDINISRPQVTGDYETKVTDTSTPVTEELAKE